MFSCIQVRVIQVLAEIGSLSHLRIRAYRNQGKHQQRHGDAD
ncbi:MAG: hypothetical protein QOJ42_5552 [Acidobacteriaceae bacterium]|jgi:hypothetical protein|nr:hypothetical protein [Acidobacteriaceae bacterium]